MANDKFSFGEFLKRYRTDEDCLEEIKDLAYPDGITCKICQKVTAHYKRKKRMAYSCEFCGHDVYPLAKTVFRGSRIPLRFWFYAIFVLTQTRCGVSSKTLQRELGISYKTALRMTHQIRKAMKEEGIILSETVEVDETYWGANKYFRRYVPYFNEKPREAIMGIIERDGLERVVTKHLADTSKFTMLGMIKDHVPLTSPIMTDQHPNYMGLRKRGYDHNWVTHQKEFVKKSDPNVYTNGIECYWSQLKRGLRGVYRRPSPKYLQAYLDEFSWRFNHRKEPDKMFDALLKDTLV